MVRTGSEKLMTKKRAAEAALWKRGLLKERSLLKKLQDRLRGLVGIGQSRSAGLH